eukprot:TRINITY_DN63249_c0_g1_i1.p1 TRINITY_DN63249_c0_g1~~TRINITY_DN63249_c0_g1_i1.p1  ORF type:complete len:657 (-),score=119.98 TRINITY_DN63249_c0_g1_i1:73-2043(-)
MADYKSLGNDDAKSGFAEKVRGFLPILKWLPEYKAEYFITDASAGVTLGLMCLSQTLAQAAIATTLPISGPYCAFVPPIIYAILGSSKHCSISSGSMGCILIASVLDDSLSIEARTELAALLALIAGIFQILMGALRLAFAVRFLSQATISGFVTGGAVLIMASQLKSLFGYTTIPPAQGAAAKLPGALKKIWVSVANYENTNVVNFGLCLGLLLVLDLCKRARAKAKKEMKKEGASSAWSILETVSTLKEIIVLAIGVSFAYVTMPDDGEAHVPIVGSIPAGLPTFKPPFGEATMSILRGPSDKLQAFIISGAMVAFTNYLTTYASNKKVALSQGYDLDASQELFALGSASAVGAFFGAFQATGSLSRTALAAQLGTQSQVVGLVQAGVIALSLLLLSPVLYYLPKAALAAIVLTSAKGLMDFTTPSEIWNSDKKTFHGGLGKDFLVWCVAFTVTVLFDALYGIGVAVAVSLGQVIMEATSPKSSKLGNMNGRFRDVCSSPSAQTFHGILIFEFRGPLCFCSAEGFQESLLSNMTSDVKCVILSFGTVEYVDYSGLKVLKEVLLHFKHDGIFCVVAEAKSRVSDLLKEKFSQGEYFKDFGGISIEDAVVVCQKRINDEKHGLSRTYTAVAVDVQQRSAKKLEDLLHQSLESIDEI